MRETPDKSRLAYLAYPMIFLCSSKSRVFRFTY
jgi:hypothetical protein